ncbi:hypothetical protein [Leyella stercorea]|uniref:hypothetical protein n=1 Tax=Leyella stercorea TaxID=363265 RepID=UPI0024314DB8|nr:hypothetical protein [Leyella stercorea]
MIRIDRRRCLRRPMRMSAPTDADVCADRCGWYQHLITSPQQHLFTTSTSYPLRCE